MEKKPGARSSSRFRASHRASSRHSRNKKMGGMGGVHLYNETHLRHMSPNPHPHSQSTCYEDAVNEEEEGNEEEEIGKEIEEFMQKRGRQQVRSNTGIFQQTIEDILSDFRQSQSSLKTFLQEQNQQASYADLCSIATFDQIIALYKKSRQSPNGIEQVKAKLPQLLQKYHKQQQNKQTLSACTTNKAVQTEMGDLGEEERKMQSRQIIATLRRELDRKEIMLNCLRSEKKAAGMFHDKIAEMDVVNTQLMTDLQLKNQSIEQLETQLLNRKVQVRHLEGQYKKVQQKLLDKSTEVRKKMAELEKKMATERRKGPISVKDIDQMSQFKDMARQIMRYKRFRQKKLRKMNSFKAFRSGMLEENVRTQGVIRSEKTHQSLKDFAEESDDSSRDSVKQIREEELNTIMNIVKKYLGNDMPEDDQGSMTQISWNGKQKGAKNGDRRAEWTDLQSQRSASIKLIKDQRGSKEVNKVNVTPEFEDQRFSLQSKSKKRIINNQGSFLRDTKKQSTEFLKGDNKQQRKSSLLKKKRCSVRVALQSHKQEDEFVRIPRNSSAHSLQNAMNDNKLGLKFPLMGKNKKAVSFQIHNATGCQLDQKVIEICISGANKEGGSLLQKCREQMEGKRSMTGQRLSVGAGLRQGNKKKSTFFKQGGRNERMSNLNSLENSEESIIEKEVSTLDHSGQNSVKPQTLPKDWQAQARHLTLRATSKAELTQALKRLHRACGQNCQHVQKYLDYYDKIQKEQRRAMKVNIENIHRHIG